MEKFFNWVWVVFYTVLPIYFVIILMCSVFMNIKINDLISYDWWLFFFVFELWGMNIAKTRLDEAFEKIKNK